MNFDFFDIISNASSSWASSNSPSASNVAARNSVYVTTPFRFTSSFSKRSCSSSGELPECLKPSMNSGFVSVPLCVVSSLVKSFSNFTGGDFMAKQFRATRLSAGATRNKKKLVTSSFGNFQVATALSIHRCCKAPAADKRSPAFTIAVCCTNSLESSENCHPR